MKVPKHPGDGLTAQKSLHVFSVAPKFINISAWGMTRLAHLSSHGPLISKGAAWKNRNVLLFGATVYRLRVESLLCNWIMLWWFYAAQLSLAHSISLYSILLAKTLAWPSTFDLNTVVYDVLWLKLAWYYFLLSVGALSFAWFSPYSHRYCRHLNPVTVSKKKCKSGRTDTPDFWCVKHWNYISQNPWCVSRGLQPALKHRLSWWFQGGRKILENVAK